MKYYVAVVQVENEINPILTDRAMWNAEYIATIDGQDLTVMKSRWLKSFGKEESRTFAEAASILNAHIAFTLSRAHNNSQTGRREAALAKLTDEDKKILGLSS